ncbi:MAG TPA: glyoxalase/bleomycin resistance/extradiol dioxygenase family protein [Ilumatobacter sp.]|nr:glyoxalase/bleomycin resistance/extradiol dioxygenase family protein [Ilumatobacter sp.]
MAFYPYLFFGRDCREAFEFYKQVFGGELTLITMNEMPSSEQPTSADQGDLIAHAALTFDDGQLLMGSDDPTTENPGPVTGMMVNYSVPDVDAATKAFNSLAEGGEVRMQISPTSWSPAFGMCVDRFGTPWMVSGDPTDSS